jgi:DNA-binding response OmpR family regulator
MHGTVLTQTLRRTHLIPRVLFISGNDDDLQAVADAGLPGATTARKPLAGDELLERVRSALDQSITLGRATRTSL